RDRRPWRAGWLCVGPPSLPDHAMGRPGRHLGVAPKLPMPRYPPQRALRGLLAERDPVRDRLRLRGSGGSLSRPLEIRALVRAGASSRGGIWAFGTGGVPRMGGAAQHVQHVLIATIPPGV